VTTYVVSMLAVAGLLSAGVYLLLERSLTRMLLGLLLISNAVNLLIINAGGPPGNPPVRDHGGATRPATADPLAQAMVLTAIVITMGAAAFVLALAYRSYRLTTAERVGDDLEDVRVSRLSGSEAGAVDEDEPEPVPISGSDDPHELDAIPPEGRNGP